MATQTKRSSSRKKSARRTRKGGDKGPGNQAELMAAMAKGLGNHEIQQRLKRAGGQRDAMLAFIVDRLKKVRDVQLRESAVLNQKDQWWRDAAWREPGVWSPEPQRWATVAKEYRLAIEALCRGDLTRGAQLLERAMNTERAAVEAVPTGMGLLPDEEAERGEGFQGPPGMDEVEQGEGCPECERPADAKLAGEIERFTHTARDLRGIRVIPHATPWWEEEEEEEEEEGEGG